METQQYNHKIIVVDDQVIMQRLVKQYLTDMGVSNVLIFNNAPDALSALRTEPVDLIISDWMMPDMDGLMFLKEVRQDEHLKNIPFLMMTLVDQKEKKSFTSKEKTVDSKSLLLL